MAKVRRKMMVGEIVPWKGDARGLTAGTVVSAARRLRVDELIVQAIMDVEGGGRFFRSDGTLMRRFEPHLMPGSRSKWRDSLSISEAKRERLWLDAYRADSNAALMATSWGAFQILGRWYDVLGYGSASAMVRAFANSADAQVRGFVRFLQVNGADAALRSGDWDSFAASYNGPGQVPVYARRIRSAISRRGGDPNSVVLSRGDRGPAVRDVQSALGISIDGVFGPDTEAAVRSFQKSRRLPVDGIVGRVTHAELFQAVDEGSLSKQVHRARLSQVIEPGLAVLSGSQSAILGLLRALPGDQGSVLGWVLVGSICVFVLVGVVASVRRLF